MELPLNIDQEAAADGFFDFLHSDATELRIRGPGGVGKTFLMGYMIDKVLPQYFEACGLMGIKPLYTEVVMCATTNKASEVLGRSTNRPTSTVHSFMNLKVEDDYQTGKSRLVKNGNWQIYTGKVIFVDEASMVDTLLLASIREGTTKCKIVWVGDHCQLAPVGETTSQVYLDEMPSFDLTIPMRNANQPALQALCAQARNTVETGVFGDIQIVPGVIDLFDGPEMQAEIDDRFIDPEYNGRILTYTNKRAIDFNIHIRGIRGLPEQFQIGEHLVNNTAIRIGKVQLSVEEEIEIIDLDTAITEVEVNPDVAVEVRLATIRNGFGDTIYNVKLPIDRDHYNSLLAYYRKLKNWNRFYFLKNNFPDLRQRDACTGYKAQGSTVETIYIDLSDFSSCRNPEQASRLFYVGFSRATTRIVLWGELNPKYGRLVF